MTGVVNSVIIISYSDIVHVQSAKRRERETERERETHTHKGVSVVTAGW